MSEWIDIYFTSKRVHNSLVAIQGMVAHICNYSTQEAKVGE